MKRTLSAVETPASPNNPARLKTEASTGNPMATGSSENATDSLRALNETKSMLLETRFDVKRTPEVFARELVSTPQLANAFLMLDPDYAKKQGKDSEYFNLFNRASKMHSGLGHSNTVTSQKHLKMSVRFRESLSMGLHSNMGTKSMEEIVAEIDAMSMDTVMMSDAHMLEMQMQTLLEIKEKFTGVSEKDNKENYNILNNARILLAVGHKTSTSLISRWLIRSGLKTKVVTTGEEAWNLIQGEKFDLLLADAILDEITGIKLVKMLKGKPSLKNIPVILMSSTKNAEEAFTAGAADYLTKPVGKNMLLKKLEIVLENAFYKNMIRRYKALTGTKDTGDAGLDYDPSKVEIIVVDDDLVTRKLVNRWLTTSQYKVVLCKTGVQAWETIQKMTKETTRTPDGITRMILTDVTMPELSGFKLLDWVMSDINTKHIPVIMMSAVHTDHSGKERSILNGSQDFLVKPFTKKVVVSKIRTLMETVVARRNRRLREMIKSRK